MRILHCADIHLDSKLNANLDAVKSRERRAELVVSFKRLVEYAISNSVDGIIIAGDLFDTGLISNATIGVIEHCIRKYPQLDFFYLKGNHDEKDIVADWNLPNLKVFGDDWTSFVASEDKNVIISGAVHPSTEPILDPANINIVVLHGQIYESGAKEAINLAALRHRSIDYLALGHIHKFSSGELDSRGVYCYPGCLESRGFDECEEHGIVIIDIDEHRNITKNFVKWGSRQAYRIEVDISECFDTFEALAKIEQLLENRKVTDKDMVEVILTGNMSELAQISTTILENDLSNKYYCIKLKDTTGIKIDLDEYTREISLKSEFIKIVMADDSLNKETKDEIIKTGLLALAGESI